MQIKNVLFNRIMPQMCKFFLNKMLLIMYILKPIMTLELKEEVRELLTKLPNCVQHINMTIIVS